MRTFLSAFLLICLLACNGPANEAKTSKESEEITEVEEEEIIAAPSFTETFPALVQFLKSEDSSFTPAQFTTGEIISKDSTAPQGIDSSLKIYWPYFIFNSDSSLALDMVSYNFIIAKIKGKQELEFAGPDTEIAVINIEKNTRKRILFVGSSGIVLDGKFDKSGNIILAGAEDVGDGKIHPIMWKYYMSSMELEVFTYPGTVNASVSKYYDIKYKPLKTSRAF